MSARHTPGPWHRNIKPASKYPVVWSGRNTHVAVIATGWRHGAELPEEEQEANIDLIAAAPDMLDALKRCDRLLTHLLDMHGPSDITGRPESEDDPTLTAVRALIARVETRP